MSPSFIDQTFTFTQPDGTPLEVRGTGDEHHAIFETLDGYTVVQDPTSGFWHYAELGPSGDLKPHTARPGDTDPSRIGLPKGLRPASKQASPSTSGLPRTQTRWEERRNQRRAELEKLMREEKN